MEAARAWGVSPSVFAGRRVVDGRQFTSWDTALGVALHRIEAAACAGCGRDRLQALDPEMDGQFVAEPLRCHACAARDRASSAFAGDSAGLKFAVMTRDEYAAGRAAQAAQADKDTSDG